MSAPRRRLRRFAKYTGFILCVLIFGVWLASRWWQCGVGRSGSNEMVVVIVSEGKIEIDLWTGRVTPGWHGSAGSTDSPRWQWSPQLRQLGTDWFVNIPLWIPFLVLTLPTTTLFCLDRRVLPGHCPNCRYDLTGNTMNVCPECGHAVANNQA